MTGSYAVKVTAIENCATAGHALQWGNPLW